MESEKPKDSPLTKAIEKEMKNWRVLPLNQLDSVTEMAQAMSQYCLIADKTGHANTFFEYKRHLKDFHVEVISTQMGASTEAEACEYLRKSLVHCMRLGDTLVINCDKTRPCFKSQFTNEEFPTETVFEFDALREEANYMKFVRPDENRDFEGNENCFHMQDTFQIVVLVTYTSDQDLWEFCQKLPWNEEFSKIIIADDGEAGEFAKGLNKSIATNAANLKKNIE